MSDETHYRRMAALATARTATRDLGEALAQMEEATAIRRRGRRQLALLLTLSAALALVAPVGRLAVYVWSVVGS